MMREDCHHCFVTKTTGIVPVNNCTTGEDHSMLIGIEGNGKMLPVDQVGADRMAPVHRPPDSIVRVMLVEQVIFIGVENESVWVIHPFFDRSEMILGAVGFVERQLGETLCVEKRDGSATLGSCKQN